MSAEMKYETRKIVMNGDRRNLHKLESLGSEAFTIERKREDVENVDEDERKRKSVKKIDNMLAKELTRETMRVIIRHLSCVIVQSVCVRFR